MAVRQVTNRMVWVLSGGRCARCKSSVVDYTISPVAVGEVAHAAAQGDGPGAPRPVPAMTDEQRDDVANLLLLCPTCHDLMDQLDGTEVYTLDQVREMKRAHEDAVQGLLELFDGHQTLILRALGPIRGQTAQAGRKEVAAATAARGRVPTYPPGRWRREVEADLSSVLEDDPAYWEVCLRILAREIAVVHDAVRRGDADHVTVFPFARLPLLVALGWLLDDTTRVDVVQRSRLTGWMPSDAAPASFAVDVESSDRSDAALLLVGVSGTPDLGSLPDDVTRLPTASIAVTSRGSVNIADSDANRDEFERALRAVLFDLEAHVTKPAALHVVAAAPISMAVAIGRAVDPQVFDTVHVLDLTPSDGYRHVLSLPRKDLPA
jgi:hypothetical protein